MAKVVVKGTTLQVQVVNTFTNVAQMIDFDGPDAEVQMMDTTAIDSGVGMEHKWTGYVDGGKVSGTCFLDGSVSIHKTLAEKIQAPPATADAWKLNFVDTNTTSWSFNGYLTKWAASGKVNDSLQVKFEITLDGIPTYP